MAENDQSGTSIEQLRAVLADIDLEIVQIEERYDGLPLNRLVELRRRLNEVTMSLRHVQFELHKRNEALALIDQHDRLKWRLYQIAVAEPVKNIPETDSSATG